MHFTALLPAILALVAAASPVEKQDPPIPARYKDKTLARYLYDTEDSYPFQEIPFQAINGSIIYTREQPKRIPPLATYLGAANYTAYYIDAPTIQLYTSSEFPQHLYVDRDLSIRYQKIGEPIPLGANATVFSDLDSVGGFLNVQGSVTQLNGTKSYFKGTQNCPLPGQSPADASTPGPYALYAQPSPPDFNTPGGGLPASPGCVLSGLEFSIDATKVAPGLDVVFYVPDVPAAYGYAPCEITAEEVCLLQKGIN